MSYAVGDIFTHPGQPSGPIVRVITSLSDMTVVQWEVNDSLDSEASLYTIVL